MKLSVAVVLVLAISLSFSFLAMAVPSGNLWKTSLNISNSTKLNISEIKYLIQTIRSNLHEKIFPNANKTNPNISTSLVVTKATSWPNPPSKNSRIHAIVQLNYLPKKSEREALEKNRSIDLINYIPENLWIANIPRNYRPILQDPIISIIPISPESKMSSRVKSLMTNKQVAGKKIDMVLTFYDDVSVSEINIILKKYKLKPTEKSFNSYVVSISPLQAYQIVREQDNVQFIDLIDTAVPALDQSRQNLGVNDVQSTPYVTTPYNLSGLGVIIAMWEAQSVGNYYPDYRNQSDLNYYNTSISRITLKDNTTANPTPSIHATHVAGIMAGNGFNNASIGWPYRGFAPKALIKAYTVSNSGFEMETEAQQGTHISQNSWGYYTGSSIDCQNLGRYHSACVAYDKIINNASYTISIVFSIGNARNDGSSCNTSDSQYPYLTPAPPATCKNVIGVGGLNSADDSMFYVRSGFGPTRDNRIKPDLMAYGTDPISDSQVPGLRIYSTSTNQRYTGLQGTSQAAPMVSGTIALMLEYFNRTRGTQDIWPNTIKAILIHTAKDVNETGPDFATGWGKIQTNESIYMIEKDNLARQSNTPLIINETIIDQDDFDIYHVNITNTSKPLKITLVWDDVEAVTDPAGGPPGIYYKTLINDLDLEVYGPDRTRFYPWWPNASGDFANRQVNAGNLVYAEDHINNVEQVYINTSSLQAGEYRIKVSGHVMGDLNQPTRYTIISSVPFNHYPGEPPGPNGEMCGMIINSGNPNIINGTFSIEKDIVCQARDIGIYTPIAMKSAAIILNVSNIVLDCNNHKIEGNYDYAYHDNYWMHNGIEMDWNNGRNVTIKNCIIQGFGASGIIAGAAGFDASSVLDNTVIDSLYGISTAALNVGLISGNIVQNNSDVGIWITSESVFVNVTNNDVRFNKGDGVQLAYSNSYNRIFSNNITNNNGFGVRIAYDVFGGIQQGNDIYDNNLSDNNKGCYYDAFSGMNSLVNNICGTSGGSEPAINFGYSVSSGNINGDAYKDIIVSAPYANANNKNDTGKIFVFLGNNYTQGTQLSLQDANTIINGAYDNELAGSSLASGDINGDGFDDIVIGAAYADVDGRRDAGKVYVIYGGSLPSEINLSNANFTIKGNAEAGNLGIVVTTGDMNGDGKMDIIASAYGENVSGVRAGRVYIIYGGNLSGVKDLSNSEANVTISGNQQYQQFGRSLSIGDVNGDNYADIAIGSPYYSKDNLTLNMSLKDVCWNAVNLNLSDVICVVNSTLNYTGNEVCSGAGYIDSSQIWAAKNLTGNETCIIHEIIFSGGVFIFYGNSSLPQQMTQDQRNILIYGYDHYTWLGSSTAFGKINSTAEDVIFSYDHLNSSDTKLFVGHLGIIYNLSRFSEMEIIANYSNVGTIVTGAYSLAPIGFVTTTGKIHNTNDDVITTSPEASVYGKSSGILYTLFSERMENKISLDQANGSNLTVYGDTTNDKLGSSIASSDVNNDGYEDVMVSAPYADSYLTDTGKVYIFYGASTVNRNATAKNADVVIRGE